MFEARYISASKTFLASSVENFNPPVTCCSEFVGDVPGAVRGVVVDNEEMPLTSCCGFKLERYGSNDRVEVFRFVIGGQDKPDGG
jgi:hypothetical protein